MSPTKKVVEWDPNKGVACQGDVVLVRLPDHFQTRNLFEVPPGAAGLILQEGEASGHMHAIINPQPAMLHDEALARSLPTSEKKDEPSKKSASARFYNTLETEQFAALGRGCEKAALGVLHVEGGSVKLQHPEHDTIQIPEGRYYVGGQLEAKEQTVVRATD
jgi:hypothetical protein